MTDSTLRLSIDARPAAEGARQFSRSANNIKKEAGGVVGAVNKADGAFKRVTQSVFSLQGALTALGGGAALGQIIRRFSDFERQLTEVGKTADLEGRRLDRLGSRVQEIAQRVPLATGRILDLASAAGQLGVTGVDNIAKFAETLAKLETATDLAGQEGARSLARLLNITGQAVSNIDRLGASITALGNNFATTEAEITQTSTFLASSTQQFDLSAQQVLGLSAALRSLGQRAETSGSSVGAALTEINTAITQGGERLQTLVNLTGQSARQLRQEFGENAVAVLTDFSEALGSIPAARQTEILDQFNLAGRETRRVIGALASDTELVRDALRTANSEWERNQALNREAARAADTFSGQMQIVTNALDEAAVIAGRELAPVILDLATDFRDFLQQASDAGQIETFFERASRAAQGFFDKLQEIFRGIAAISLGLKGASLGARFGGLPGAIAGGATGAGVGFFSPELLSELARRVADAREEVSAFGADIESAMTRATGSTRNVINRLSQLEQQAADISKGIGVNAESGGIDQDKLESQLQSLNAELQTTAEAQTAVGNAVSAALDQVGGSISSYKELQTVQQALAASAGVLASAQQEASDSTSDAGDTAEDAAIKMADLNEVLAFSKTAFEETGDGADEAASAFQRVTESLRQEIELVGATREERELSNALRRAGADLTDQQRRQIVALVSELESERQAQEAANRVLEDATTGFLETQRLAERNTDTIEETSDATRDLGIQTQSTADIMRGAFEEVGRSIQSGIRDALLGAERSLVDTAKRIAADIAAAFATQRIIIPAFVQPVAGALGLAGSTGSAAAGQGGAAGGVGGIGNAVSAGSFLSNLGSGLTTPSISASGLANFAPSIFSGGAQAAAPTAASGAITAIPAGGGTAPNALASGLSAASTPLGIGGGLIGGFAANQVFGGGIGTSAGSGLGGLAGGAALGAAFGPIGAGIGALLGSFAGGGVGSLFGSDTKPAGLLGTRLEFSGGRVSGIDPRSGQKDVDPEEAQKFRESTVQAINTALGAADATANAPFDILSNVKDRQKTNLIFRNTEAGRASAAQARQALGVGGEGQTVNLSDEANDVEAVIRALLTPAVGIADNIGQDVATAVRNSTADNVEDLLSDVQFAGNFEDRIEAFSQGFQKLSDSIRGQTVQNIDSFVESIRDFNSRTEELGLSVSEAEDATASFIRKQLGIGDAIPQEQLTQFQQGQIRLKTTLEEVQNPSSDLRELLDDLGISADKAANAIQRQISANNEQRDARLATQFQNVFGDPTLNERITAQGLPTRLANAVRGAVTFANQNDIEAGSQVSENLGDDLIRIASQIGTDVSPALDLLNNALEGTADASNNAADVANDNADAQQDISRALEDQIGQFREFRDEIAQTQRDLRFGSNSPLSPERRFNTLQAEFQRVSQRAQAGNEQALQRLPQVAQEFDAARTAFLGNATDRSQRVFENIQSALEGAETTADRRLDALQDQLTELNNIEGSIESQTRQLDQWINSLPQSIANALGPLLDDIGGAGGGGSGGAGGGGSGGAGGGSSRRGFDSSRSTTTSGTVDAGQEVVRGPGGGFIPAESARDQIDRQLNDIYESELGRDFDQAGRDFYRDRIESGTSLDQIREEIENNAAAGARAMGGPVTAGSSYLVGERGPELFVPNTSGTVVSNSDTSNLGGKLDGVSQRLDAILNVLVERGEMDSEERSALVEEVRGVARETKRSRAA